MPAAPAYSFPLALIYFGQLAGFSLSILVTSNWRPDRSSMIWLGANVCSAVALTVSYPQSNPYSSAALPIAVAFLVVNFGLKWLALLPQKNNGEMFGDQRAIFVLMALGVIFAYTVPAPYRSILVCGMSFVMSCVSMNTVRRDRRWRGYRGLYIMLYTATATTFLFSVRAVVELLNTFAILELPRVDVATLDAISTVGMIASSAVLQAGFVGLITAQQSRARQRAKRRLARASEHMLGERLYAKQIQQLADQRLNLLNLLTHEVRQPLHNAQAGLQSFLTELEHHQISPERLSFAARATQGVLDGITLSLTNAITGTRLIEQDSIDQLRQTGMAETAAMAQLDCPPYLQHRIHMTLPSPEMFIDVEPVLLRLALRNLLDNALKYSPADTPVTFEILEEGTELGVLFRVTNDLANDHSLDGDIFGRDQRGTSAYAEGQGLGLYIVKRVAQLHDGSVNMRRLGASQVVFELFLPG